MKLHYSNILLFFLPLNIVVTSYHAHNNNKPSITTHHIPICTSRVLSECDAQSTNYNNNTDIKSVKEKFDRQTSQRFEEYEQRMKDKRQKRKEKRDKNIQEIILKDKMDKSLSEKIEKGCFRCGCGLGGVAASVGLFGGLGIYGWKSAATATAISKVAAAAKAQGDAAGVKALIKGLGDELGIQNLFDSTFAKAITPNNYFCETLVFDEIKIFYKSLSEKELTFENYPMFYSYRTKQEAELNGLLAQYAKSSVEEAVEEATNVTTKFTESQMETLQGGKLAEITTASTQLYSAIGYSVLTILIIVLVLVIIYLVLRYRRKKKMKKKAEYTKLLNQ
ncbi:rifin [Plasmodium reichenowi]|uniref:Rifin n=1 Tax=Plasmodium reichenowi TaxID=5854 RepID=A0A060RM42_PLARE|nr:rifin [Plasmodium reichenowi]